MTESITPQDAKNLLILLNRVPNITVAEVDEFVSLRSKLGQLAALGEPVEPAGPNPLAPPNHHEQVPVLVGPTPPRRARARKSTKRTR